MRMMHLLSVRDYNSLLMVALFVIIIAPGFHSKFYIGQTGR